MGSLLEEHGVSGQNHLARDLPLHPGVMFSQMLGHAPERLELDGLCGAKIVLSGDSTHITRLERRFEARAHSRPADSDS